MATNSGPLLVPPRATGPGTATVTVTNDIRDIKPPVPIANPWLWLWWGLALAVVAAGAVALWLWWRRSLAKLPPVPPIPPHVRARQKLQAALALIHDPRLFCIEVSDTVRLYLEERFNFRAPERTTEEFLFELQETTLLLPDQKQSLAESLQGCDLVKFARYEPTESALRELHDAALRLVEETQFESIAAPGDGGGGEVR
jgi:hypothetical protein